MVTLLTESNDPGLIPKTLIFTRTKEVAVKIFKHILQHTRSKEYVSMFHASLTSTTKKHIVSRFHATQTSLRIVVATIAFGMVCIMHVHTIHSYSQLVFP